MKKGLLLLGFVVLGLVVLGVIFAARKKANKKQTQNGANYREVDFKSSNFTPSETVRTDFLPLMMVPTVNHMKEYGVTKKEFRQLVESKADDMRYKTNKLVRNRNLNLSQLENAQDVSRNGLGRVLMGSERGGLVRDMYMNQGEDAIQSKREGKVKMLTGNMPVGGKKFNANEHRMSAV
jgi:hypothetical protein